MTIAKAPQGWGPDQSAGEKAGYGQLSTRQSAWSAWSRLSSAGLVVDGSARLADRIHLTHLYYLVLTPSLILDLLPLDSQGNLILSAYTLS